MNNILKIYNLATPNQIAEGMSWYPEAYRVCATLAEQFNYPIKTVVYALACLSPNNKWEQNILDAVSLLKDKELEKKMEQYESGDKTAFKLLSCRTWSNNVYKASKILTTNDTSHLSGRKVSAFADNIFNPDSEKVTIDGHALSVYLGEKLTMNEANKLMYQGYGKAEEAYRDCAFGLKIRPYQLQAITWVVWRNTTLS